MQRLAYIDSSIALKLILDEATSPRARAKIAELKASGHQLTSSALLAVEIRRALLRVQGSFEGADELISNFALVSLTQSILDVASSLPRPVKSLDAIHVATAMVAENGDRDTDLILVSHDDTMLQVGESEGLVVTNI